MNHFVTAVAITSTLILVQGCSSAVKSGHKPGSMSHTTTPNQDNHDNGHGMSHGKMPEMDGMDRDKESVKTQGKLNIPNNIKPQTTVPLVIQVQDKEGKPIDKFDTFQEKIMHLIVVSDDLDFFNHIHPNYKENGRFEVTTTFPTEGNYTLFSDYKPAGQKEQISVMKAQIPGRKSSPAKIDLNLTKIFSDTKVKFSLSSSSATIKARENITLMFDLRDKTSNQPLTDLQPYLGERGHLVIIKQSSPLTETDYLHVHAIKNSPKGQINFMTNFPQPGKYKVWGQFNRGGEIVTADFWLDVL